jgi:hypothetical protein
MIRFIVRMRRVYRGDQTPITILVNEPSPWPQALHHTANGVLLFACKPEEQEASADQIK